MRAIIESWEKLTAKLLKEGDDAIVSLVDRAKAVTSRAQNGTGSVQPSFKVWAWNDDNTVVLADADFFELTDFAGVNPDLIGVDKVGTFVRLGRIAGALEGLGCTAGDLIYLSKTEGELTKIAPTNGSIIFVIGQAEPSSASALEADDLFVNPRLIG
jgi:hypothetical protein